MAKTTTKYIKKYVIHNIMKEIKAQPTETLVSSIKEELNNHFKQYCNTELHYNNCIALLDLIQGYNHTTFKTKRIKNSNLYFKLADRFTLLNSHVFIIASRNNFEYIKSGKIQITQQINLEGRSFLTLRIDGETNHKNHNEFYNNSKNLEFIPSQEQHRQKHREEYLAKYKKIFRKGE